MNIFKLAGMQLIKEGKNPKIDLSDLLDRAIEIRKWLDKHRLNTAKKIMQGEKIYKYHNKIKTYIGVI